MNDAAQVVERAIAGDREAFGCLVQGYQDMAVAFCLSRLGDFALAQDAAQDAFVAAFREIDGLKEPAAFPGWFLTVLRKYCDRRTRSAKPTVSLDAVHELAVSGPDPHASLERSEVRRWVLDSINALPESDREVLALFYMAEHSQAEVAAFLGVSVATVNNRLHAARGRLKEKMIPMVDDILHSERPSRDESFASAVGLCNACIVGDFDTVKRLLSTDPGLVSCRGEVYEEHMRQMALHDGWTPLHLAGHYGHLDIVKLLVDAGADLEAVALNPIGNTPISAAAYGEHIDIVEYLIEKGAQVDAPNAFGSTALHRAAECNRPEMALLLFRHGADARKQAADGRDAVQLAEDAGAPELASKLAGGA